MVAGVAGQKLNPRYSTVHGGWRGWPLLAERHALARGQSMTH